MKSQKTYWGQNRVKYTNQAYKNAEINQFKDLKNKNKREYFQAMSIMIYEFRLESRILVKSPGYNPLPIIWS